LSGIKPTQWAIVLGALLVLLVVGTAIASGIGKDDPADDSVAVVDGDQISQEDFDRSLEQAAKRQGLNEVPATSDPQYSALRDEAMNDILDTAWIQGEAAERGVEVSDEEVQREFEKTKDENFKTEKEYEQFLEESGFTQEDVDLRVRLQLISTKIQDQITEEAGAVDADEAEEFYEANKEQFEQPASRTIRLVLTEDQEDADKAVEELQEDNSPENWDKVAKEFSTDEATKDSGGVREGVTEGTFGPELDPAIFEAPVGEVEGPVQTAQGFYVFQVDSEEDAQTIPFDEARAQIEEQLSGQVQQQAFAAFLADYRDRWVEVTVCADDFLIDRCDNFEGDAQPCPDPSLPEEQQQQQLDQGACPPPVLSASPAAPGTSDPFTPVQPVPQRPHPPGEDTAAAPPGGLPGGLPPGAAPGAAPGGAPPAGAQAPPPGG
jgi:foldase protein PrsA